MKLNYAIVFVSDMKKSVAFYRDVVGLPLRFESSEWTEFETGIATLALHATKGEDSHGTTVPTEAPGGCRPGIAVDDIDAFHKRMIEHGVVCLQEPKETFGTRIGTYVDPDGLSLSVAQERSKT